MGGEREAGIPEQIGPFRLVRRLGAGGMAEVFEAVRSGPGGFEQRACVKRVLPAFGADEEFVRLFLREARLAASLGHRNITRVFDFGEDRGSHYLALELVEGMDVRRLLKALSALSDAHARPLHARGPRALPPDVAALVAMDIAEALDHAHTRSGRTGGVIHRDVSPANILVSEDGDVKLTDFGISKALDDARLTRTDAVRGNVWYMAPEQAEGPARADPRSDLFSLGVVLYECLAGRRPYHGPTELAAMIALSEGRRVPLREAAPEVPLPLAEIAERLLSPAPADRFQHASAVAMALAGWVHPIHSRRSLAALVRAHRHAHAPRPRPIARAEAPAGASAALVHMDDAPSVAATEQPRAAPARDAPTVIELPRARAPRARAPRPSSSPRERSPVAAPPPRAPMPARWRPYALAPGVWAAVDRAFEQRRGEPLDPIQLPRARWLWPAVAIAALIATALATCVISAFL